MTVLIIQCSSDRTGNFLLVYKVLFAVAEGMKNASKQKEAFFILTAKSCFAQGITLMQIALH